MLLWPVSSPQLIVAADIGHKWLLYDIGNVVSLNNNKWCPINHLAIICCDKRSQYSRQGTVLATSSHHKQSLCDWPLVTDTKRCDIILAITVIPQIWVLATKRNCSGHHRTLIASVVVLQLPREIANVPYLPVAIYLGRSRTRGTHQVLLSIPDMRDIFSIC